MQGHGGQGAEVQDQVHMDRQEDERSATQPQQRLSQAGDTWGARNSLPVCPLAHILGGQTAGGGGCRHVLGILFRGSTCGVSSSLG